MRVDVGRTPRPGQGGPWIFVGELYDDQDPAKRAVWSCAQHAAEGTHPTSEAARICAEAERRARRRNR